MVTVIVGSGQNGCDSLEQVLDDLMISQIFLKFKKIYDLIKGNFSIK